MLRNEILLTGRSTSITTLDPAETSEPIVGIAILAFCATTEDRKKVTETAVARNFMIKKNVRLEDEFLNPS